MEKVAMLAEILAPGRSFARVAGHRSTRRLERWGCSEKDQVSFLGRCWTSRNYRAGRRVGGAYQRGGDRDGQGEPDRAKRHPQGCSP